MKQFPFPVDAKVPLYLAPMARVSVSPFRRMCRRHGADVVVTEFLSAEGIRRENEATISKLRFTPDEHPIGVQIFGADPEAMGEAAALVTDVFRPDFVDINFGCPVKKVVRRNGGSGSARWEEIAAVVDAVEIPVLGNGDIKTADDALRMHRQTNCAGVMIARGSFGQPWIFDQARALLDGRPLPPAPPVAARFAVALDHAR